MSTERPHEIERRLLILLREFAFQPEQFRNRVNTAKYADGQKHTIALGVVTPPQLISLLGSVIEGGFSIGNNFHALMATLCKREIFQNLGQIADNLPSAYMFNDRAIKVFDSVGVLDTFLFDTQFLISKYTQATPAIILDKDGTESIGTSAVVRFGISNNNSFFLVTNRHVVDRHEKITIKRIEIGKADIISQVGEWCLSEEDDLAAAPINWPSSSPFFCISESAAHLTKVISFGYPKIPFADHNYIAIHSGEINSIIRTTAKETMYLISNPVSPGSSGGPVIDDRGLLVGITAKSFQGRMEPESDFFISWNAAISLRSVRRFLSRITGSVDWPERIEEIINSAPPPKETTS